MSNLLNRAVFGALVATLPVALAACSSGHTRSERLSGCSHSCGHGDHLKGDSCVHSERLSGRSHAGRGDPDFVYSGKGSQWGRIEYEEKPDTDTKEGLPSSSESEVRHYEYEYDTDADGDVEMEIDTQSDDVHRDSRSGELEIESDPDEVEIEFDER